MKFTQTYPYKVVTTFVSLIVIGVLLGTFGYLAQISNQILLSSILFNLGFGIASSAFTLGVFVWFGIQEEQKNPSMDIETSVTRALEKHQKALPNPTTLTTTEQGHLVDALIYMLGSDAIDESHLSVLRDFNVIDSSTKNQIEKKVVTSRTASSQRRPHT